MEGKLLIQNGRVLPMTGKVIPKGSVLIENGKITAVAERIEVPDTGSTEIIDASGCLVMPGLIEAHCHVGITEEKKGMEGDDCNENVSPVTPWLRAIDAVNTMDAAFDDAVRAGITSIMAGPGSSNVVGGQFAFIKTKGRRIDDLIVKAPAAMKIAFGENPKVNFSGQEKSPVTRMAIAGILREELHKAVQYRKKKMRLTKACPKGQEPDFEPDFRLECWMPVLEGKIPLDIPEKFRLIPYHSLGKKHGIMQAVEIEKLKVKKEGQELVIEKALLGLYENKVTQSGAYQMILHPALLENRRNGHDIKSCNTRKNAV